MNQIQFSEWPTQNPKARLGVVLLNNPKALNSLTLEMVERCGQKLMEWENNPEIVCVVFYSDLEKAFCAGGDVKTVVFELNAGDPCRYAAEFFRWEYKMDYTLQTYKKPIVTWGDGIVMGGGMGIFAGSSHRVVTERSVMAMPEINIGFFPDVGAGVFLNRLPKPIAVFMALTAARLNATDAIDLKLATHFIESKSKHDTFKSLRDVSWTRNSKTDLELLSQALNSFAQKPSPESQVEPAMNEISQAVRVELEPGELLNQFSEYAFESKWAKAAQENFKTGSPTSALVSLEQLRRAESLSVLDVFVMEWTIARQMCKRGEFTEGVRSRLIDKDNKPRWQPARLKDVNGEQVLAHFEPFRAQGESEAEIRKFFETRTLISD